MYPKLFLMTICVSICLIPGSIAASTFVFDEFDDGDIATNTSGVGSGFEIYAGGGSVTEADGLAIILGGDSGANRNQMGSKDSFSANNSTVFGIFTVTDMHRTNSADNGTARFYVGFSDALPNGQGPLQTSSVNGLWIVLHGRYTYTGVDTWNTGDGGLVYVSNGVRTALAQWTWDSSVFTFDTASNLRSDRVALDMVASDLTFVLSSDAVSYSLSISSKDGTVVLPDPISGTWAEAGLTNDLGEVYASAWTQGASPDNPMGLVLDRIVVNDEGWAEGPKFPLARSPKPADGAILEVTWANLSWRAGDFAVSHNVYIGEDFDEVNTGAEGTFVGNQTETMLIVGFPGFAYPEGLVPGTTYYWRVDEVNDADPNSPWKGPVWSFSIAPRTAYNPNPADGAEFVDPNNVKLSWIPGFGAVLHTVYFGDDFDTVDNASGGSPQGSETYSPGTLEREKVYYWRVDEFDAITTSKGDVWSFTTSGAVGNPQPAYKATDVGMNATLSWTLADSAASHEVYFGTDEAAVRSASAASPEYKGSVALGAESYDPGLLEADTTYYWRVDEVDGQGNMVKGPLWIFTTGAFLLVDDFEDYTDDDSAGEAIWQTWIDGFGVADNGAQVGYLFPPYAEQTIVHGGLQSMPLLYVNEAGVTNSEGSMTLTALRDWTQAGAAELSLWFRGSANNASEPLYVALANSGGAPAVVAHSDASAAAIRSWTQWRIPLQAFGDQGINLSNLDKLAIGLGSRGGIAAGGTGTVYIDDIRLYQPTL